MKNAISYGKRGKRFRMLLPVLCLAVLLCACTGGDDEPYETGGGRSSRNGRTKTASTEDTGTTEEDTGTTEENTGSTEADTGNSGETADEELYAPVLGEILGLIRDGEDAAGPFPYTPMGMFERVMYEENRETLLKSIGYAITDISGDGVPELLIGEDTAFELEHGEKTTTVYACYTLKRDEIVCTFEGYARSAYQWMGDGTFYYFGSAGAAHSLCGTARLSKDGTDLVWNDFYFTDLNNAGEIAIFYNTTGDFDTHMSEETDITFEEFQAITEAWENSRKTLAMRPLGECDVALPGGSTSGAGNYDPDFEYYDRLWESVPGLWTGDDGTSFEVFDDYTYEMYDVNGSVLSVGTVDRGAVTVACMIFLNDGGQGGDTLLVGEVEELSDGTLTVWNSINAMNFRDDPSGATYTKRGTGSAKKEPGDVPVAVPGEEFEGNWVNTETWDMLYLYYWRGEFELTLGTTGDYHAGEVIYNGNADQPEYQLVTTDGYHLADFYFRESALYDEYEMVITFHYALNDVTGILYHAKG